MPGMMSMTPTTNTPSVAGGEGGKGGITRGDAAAAEGKGFTRKGRRGSLRKMMSNNAAGGKAGELVGSRGIRRSASLPTTGNPPPLPVGHVAASPLSRKRPTTTLIAGEGEATELSTPAADGDQHLGGFDQDPLVDQELGGFGDDLPASPVTDSTPPAEFGQVLSDSEHDDEDYDAEEQSGSENYSDDDDHHHHDDDDDDEDGSSSSDGDDMLGGLGGFDSTDAASAAAAVPADKFGGFDAPSGSAAAATANRPQQNAAFAAHTSFDDSDSDSGGDSDESEP